MIEVPDKEKKISIPSPTRDLKIVSDGVTKVFRDVGGMLGSISDSMPEIPRAEVPKMFSALPKIPEAPASAPKGPYSYPGQTPEDYCVECLIRHYSKAHGLMKEGERFSLKSGKLLPESRQRIRAAVEEMVTAEEDLGTEIKDKKLKKMIDEIDVRQRDLRKYIWAEKLTTTQESIDSLRGAIDRAKELVNMTYKAAEPCPKCDELIDKVCKGLSGDEKVKCTEAIKDLAEGKK